jgi:rsbT co-antagonist protein RsbR
MDNNEKVLLLNQINDLNKRIRELENKTNKVSVPMIPSIIPDTLLVPLTFDVSVDYFDHVIQCILDYVNNSEIDSIVLDFSGFILKDCDNLELLGENIGSLISSLKLMGIRVLVVGLTPAFVKDLISSKLAFTNSLNTFSTFKAALEHLMKLKGLAIVKNL